MRPASSSADLPMNRAHLGVRDHPALLAVAQEDRHRAVVENRLELRVRVGELRVRLRELRLRARLRRDVARRHRAGDDAPVAPDGAERRFVDRLAVLRALLDRDGLAGERPRVERREPRPDLRRHDLFGAPADHQLVHVAMPLQGGAVQRADARLAVEHDHGHAGNRGERRVAARPRRPGPRLRPC